MPRKRPELGALRDPLPLLRETLDLVQKGLDLSFLALEGRTGIERRKLQRIIAGENVSLSLHELQRLDRFLATLGIDLFARKNLPLILSKSRPVAFLLPVANSPQTGRSGVNRTTTSLWDVRAMNQIRELLDRSPPSMLLREAGGPPTIASGPACQIGFQVRPVPCDEPLSGPGVEARVQRLIVAPLGEAEPLPAAVVSLGSPRASVASEWMLREMFAATRENCRGIRRFAFAWREPTPLDRDSLFSLPADEIDVRSPAGGRRRKEPPSASAADGFLLYQPEGSGPQVRVSDSRRTVGGQATWNSYGIVVVQRRGPQLWVVISGLTGPDTLAAANLLEGFSPVLAPVESADASCVVWWVVESEIHDPGTSADTDLRTLVHWRRISGPNCFWPGS